MKIIKMVAAASVLFIIVSCSFSPSPTPHSPQQPVTQYIELSRQDYADKLYGFWLAQCIANWTGLVTEMDKIGGEGIHGQFYTREDWGKIDQPSIWGEGVPSQLSQTIDFIFKQEGDIWGSDDDTDIEYMYQYLMFSQKTSQLSPEQIKHGWLTHIFSEQNTTLLLDGKPDNFLWVSNQRAHDLMSEGMLPPATGHPDNNSHFDMIDAQLTTEIFGLFAPTAPKVALQIAQLPIETTARENAKWAAEFYVVMHSLASSVDASLTQKQKILWMADVARLQLPNDSYSAKMYDFVKSQYLQGIKWEAVRDALYQRYQVEQQDGYDITARKLYCNGCFASGINFAASLVSLFYGEGDLINTIKIATLAGWDSDNPAATWGGLLGFMLGKQGIEDAFERKFSNQYNIHRTRTNFPNNGIDRFDNMAIQGLAVVDSVVIEKMGGHINIQNNSWMIPVSAQTKLQRDTPQ